MRCLKAGLRAATLGALALAMTMGCGREEEQTSRPATPAARTPPVPAPLPEAARQAGWPRLVEGAQVAYETTFEHEGALDLRGEDRVIHRIETTYEHAIRVGPVDEEGAVALRYGQGRVAVSVEGRHGSGAPFSERLAAPRLGSTALARVLLAPGTEVEARLGPDGRLVRAGTGSSESPETAPDLPAALHLLEVSPPDEPPAAGPSWEHEAVVPHPAGPDSGPVAATSAVVATDAERIVIRTEFADAAWPEERPGTAASRTIARDVVATVIYSRRDGLPLEAHVGGTLLVRLSPGYDPATFQMRGRMLRRALSTPSETEVRVSGLLRDLAAEEASTRREAAAALGEVWPGGARAVPVLEAALGDDDEGVREAAAGSLGRLGERGVEPVVAFLRDEEDPEREDYHQIVSIVVALGAKVTPKDIAAGIYGSPSPRAGVVAMALFGPAIAEATGPGDVPQASRVALAVLAHYAAPRRVLGLDLHGPPLVATAAGAAALAGMGALPPSPDRSVPPAAWALLDEEDAVLRTSGAGLLGLWGSSGPEAVSALEARLQDARPLAQAARWRIGRAAPVPDSLLAALESGNDAERAQAAVRLADWGAEGAAAVPALVEALRRAHSRPLFDDRAGLAFASALGRIGPPAEEAVPALEEVRRSLRLGGLEDSLLHAEVAAALCRIAGPTENRIGSLLGGLERAVLEPRWMNAHSMVACVASALGEVADRLDEDLARRVAAKLAEVLEARFDRRLVPVLGRLGARARVAVPHLAKVLEEAQAGYRRFLATGHEEAQSGAVTPGDPAALLTLHGRRFDDHLQTRLEIADALGAIGPAARDAVPALRRALAEGDDLMRYHAARALRRIEGP